MRSTFRFETNDIISLQALIGLCRESPCSDEDVCYGKTDLQGAQCQCVQERTCGDNNACPCLIDGKHINKLIKNVFKDNVADKADKVKFKNHDKMTRTKNSPI